VREENLTKQVRERWRSNNPYISGGLQFIHLASMDRRWEDDLKN